MFIKSNVMKTKQKHPLIVIVGPTASGKTAISIEIAKKIDGEIICADSRTIYKYMDIGTAKPNQKERAEVPHWGLDLINPGEYFSASDFKNYANQKIKEIRRRGRVPMLVGGSGLYIDSVVFDYNFGKAVNIQERQKLQQLNIEELQNYCHNNNIKLPINYKNKRHLIRAIENKGVIQEKRSTPIENSIIVGIATDKSVLIDNISRRINQMFDNGVVDEYRQLVNCFGWDNEAMKANVYILIKKYINNEIDLIEVKNTLSHLDWRLAKRQLTWFYRNPFINWLKVDEARDFIINKLSLE
ncbi:MAG: tRNA (adenosine(37)-N6)-dimethylallyltransferase MiaA [Candidatus Saccharimonadales bacterium]